MNNSQSTFAMATQLQKTINYSDTLTKYRLRLNKLLLIILYTI